MTASLALLHPNGNSNSFFCVWPLWLLFSHCTYLSATVFPTGLGIARSHCLGFTHVHITSSIREGLAWWWELNKCLMNERTKLMNQPLHCMFPLLAILLPLHPYTLSCLPHFAKSLVSKDFLYHQVPNSNFFHFSLASFMLLFSFIAWVTLWELYTMYYISLPIRM